MAMLLQNAGLQQAIFVSCADLHGDFELYKRYLTLVQRLQNGNPHIPVIPVGVGDLLRGDIFSEGTEGEGFFQTAPLIGFTMSAAGNGEMAANWPNVWRRHSATFQLLSASLFDASDNLFWAPLGEETWNSQNGEIHINGVILGLSHDDHTSYDSRNGIRAISPVEAFRDWQKEFAARFGIHIVVCHADFDVLRDMAASAPPELSFIGFAGHSHKNVSTTVLRRSRYGVGKILGSQTKGNVAGVTHVIFDGNQIVRHRYKTFPLDSASEGRGPGKDSVAARAHLIVDESIAPLKKELSAPIVTLRTSLYTVRTNFDSAAITKERWRKDPGALGFVADAVVAWINAQPGEKRVDGSIIHNGSSAAQLLLEENQTERRVSGLEVVKLMPDPDAYIVVVEISEADYARAYDRLVSRANDPRPGQWPKGRCQYVASSRGVHIKERFTPEEERETEDVCLDVTDNSGEVTRRILKENGQLSEGSRTRVLHIALTEHLAEGGSGYVTLGNGRVIRKHAVPIRDMLLWYAKELEERGGIHEPYPDWWARVEETGP